MIRYILFIALLCCFLSCEKSINPFENQAESFHLTAYQIPGCAGPQSFFRNGISENDRFYYSFEDTLKIELYVSANCCPDSNRFAYNSKIENNVIIFTVTDTAGNLCHCICDYRIHADFAGLIGHEYLFNCIYGDSLLLTETVSKNEL
ncbi:hypothetical protein JW824_02255 [bacterium]|nr:hypothetical protein [bacterium]